VSQLCQNGIQPVIICPIQKLGVQGQMVLVVEVPRFSPDRPYHAGGKYYVRDANQSREARREELIRLLQSADYHFDEQPVEGARLEDLEPGVAGAFLASIYDEPDLENVWLRLLERLQCLDRTGTPTVTGILLFGREPQRWLRDARISAVRFPGREVSSDFADRQELEGPLLEQIDAAASFARPSSMPWPIGTGRARPAVRWLFCLTFWIAQGSLAPTLLEARSQEAWRPV